MSGIRIRPWRLLTLVTLGMLLVWQASLWVSAQVSALLIRTTPAQRGAVEVVQAGQGLLARNETAFRAPMNGRLIILVHAGQRVRSGQVIAEISEVVDDELRRRLSEIDQRIAELDRETEAETVRQRARRAELDQLIQKATEELDAAVASGRDDWVAEAHAKLSRLQAERAELESLFTGVRGQLETERDTLLAMREAATAEVIGQRTYVRVDQPGIIHFSFDGLEDALQPGVYPAVDWEAIQTATWTYYSDGSLASTDQTLFRLIDNFGVHVFVQFPRAVDLQEGQRVRLRWTGIDPPGVEARVRSIHNRLEGTGVWFEVASFQPDWVHGRYLGNVEVVLQRFEGVILPRRALEERGNRIGVYVIVEGKPVFHYVNVVGGNDQEVAVSGLPPGVSVVTNPERISRR